MSSTRLRGPQMLRARDGPQLIPLGAAIPVRASEADVGDAISEAFCDSCDFQGMRLILTWLFTAKPRPGENLRWI